MFLENHALVEVLVEHVISFIEEVDVPESVFCVGGKPVHLQKRVPVRDCIKLLYNGHQLLIIAETPYQHETEICACQK